MYTYLHKYVDTTHTKFHANIHMHNKTRTHQLHTYFLAKQDAKIILRKNV